MNMPNFTAEQALYQSSATFKNSSNEGKTSTQGTVSPATCCRTHPSTGQCIPNSPWNCTCC